MQAPSDSEIEQAEQRLVQARGEVSTGTTRLNAELREFLAKPATLLGVAGIAALAGYLIFKPRPEKKVKVKLVPEGSSQAQSGSILGLLAAFAMRYAMKQIPGMGSRLVEKVAHPSKTPPAPAPAAAPATPTPVQTRSGETLH
jgi:hypothetical protein